MSLILDNCYKADLKDVESVGCPPGDGRWHPISHGHAIQLTKEAIDRAGLTITEERYALAGNKKKGDGNTRMFGELILDGGPNANLPDDFKMAIGIRNSIDKTISWNICGGENVMVCGNMLMMGDFMVRRKHTTNILADLAPMADQAIANYLVGFENRVKEVEHWKQIEIDQPDVDHIVMECWRNGAFAPNQIPNIMQEWNEPRHPEFKDRTVWSLQNAFTEAHKTRPGDPNRNADASIIAHRTFAELFPLPQAA
jgi:hypothetical protein